MAIEAFTDGAPESVRSRLALALDVDDIVEALAARTEAFAAERMNRGNRKALAGRAVTDV